MFSSQIRFSNFVAPGYGVHSMTAEAARTR